MSTEISASDYRKLTAKKPKAAKYHNKKTVVSGITFDSKKEAEFYKVLLASKRLGGIKEIELQVPFPYKILYTRFDQLGPIFSRKGRYVADFRVTYSDGTVEVIDVKGTTTAKFRRDKKIIKALYGIDIKVV